MRAILCIIIILILFYLCFIKNSIEANEFFKNMHLAQNITNTGKGELKKANFETGEQSGAKEESHNVLKSEEKRHKTLNYPPFIKKGDVTLFVNIPSDYPSYSRLSYPCKLLVNKIDNAKKEIDFALYGFDGQDEIINSLIAANKRGVVLKGVYDTKETGEATYPDTMKLTGYAKLTGDNSKYIMHNKFFVIDDKILFTGSMNISFTGCGGYNSNSVIIVENPKFVLAYKKEFEQMSNGIFKTKKEDFSSPFIELGEGVLISANFSPAGSIYQKAVASAINSAKSEIRASIFVLTDKAIINELIEAKNRGVKVRVLVDATGASGHRGKINALRQAGIKVKIENWGGKNHEKTIAVDDNTLIIGSANFSYSAYYKNDENMILIKDKDLTTFYNGFFDLMYDSVDDIYLEKFPHAEGFESGNSCFDKIDNDFDGDIDFADSRCKK